MIEHLDFSDEQMVERLAERARNAADVMRKTWCVKFNAFLEIAVLILVSAPG